MKLQLIKLISLGLTREEAIEFIKTSIKDFANIHNLDIYKEEPIDISEIEAYIELSLI